MNLEANKNLIDFALIPDEADRPALSAFFTTIALHLATHASIPEPIREVYLSVKGSTTDGLDPSKYFEVKEVIGTTEYPNPTIHAAADFGHLVPPDLHLQVHHKSIKLKMIPQEADWSLLPPGYNASINLTQVSPTKRKPRLCFKLSKDDKDLYKLDITNAPVSKKGKKTDRRGDVGGVADYNSIPLDIRDGKWVILEEKRKTKPNAARLSTMNTKKDIETFVEGVFRNGRKLISMKNSGIEYLNHNHIDFLDKKSRKKLRYLNDKKRLKRFIRGLSDFQIQTYYRELLVMAAWDYNQTIKFLYQSHLDQLFFGQKLPNHHIPILPNSDARANISSFLYYLSKNKIDLSTLAKKRDLISPSSALQPLT